MTGTPPDKSENSDRIKSVETSIGIVEALQKERISRVSEIATETGDSESNVSKHLNTLRKHGFVTKDANGYRLGLRYLAVGGFVRDEIPGSQFLKTKVAEMAMEVGEIAEFLVENQGKAVVTHRTIGNDGVPGRTRVGSHLPLHQAAAGKAMLAFMPDAETDRIIQQQRLIPATERTITDEDELYEELKEIRSVGYAINNEESTKGVSAVAAPVQDSEDTPIGACAITGPAHRLEIDSDANDLTDTVLTYANEIELRLIHS
jgi:DNA-binding IclR family transcriptional regulator